MYSKQHAGLPLQEGAGALLLLHALAWVCLLAWVCSLLCWLTLLGPGDVSGWWLEDFLLWEKN